MSPARDAGDDAGSTDQLPDEIDAIVESKINQATADLRDRIDELEAENDRLRDDIDTERETRREAEDHIKDLEATLEQHVTPRLDALSKQTDHVRSQVTELQGLELEKGYHLHVDHVNPGETEIAAGCLETITKDDGDEYYRVPETESELHQDDVALEPSDLLPIQQLARMDDDMLANATSKRPDYIAAKVWAERGKHSASTLWNQGSKSIVEFFDAGDLKTWIKANIEREDETISHEYAKKLASRTIDRLLELSKHKLGIKKRSHRKDGLKYRERRVVLKDDAQIPGEATTNADAPGTADVLG